MRALTDSGAEIKIDNSRLGISNLIRLYSLITDISIADVESQFAGKMYSDFLSELGDVMVELLRPMQKKYDQISY